MKQILLSIFMILLSINVQAQCPISITEPIGDGSAYKFYLSDIAQCAAFTPTTSVYINGPTNEYLVNDCGDLDGDGIIRVDLSFNSGPATVILATDAPISISVGTTTCYYNSLGTPTVASCPVRVTDTAFDGSYFDFKLSNIGECANYPLGMEIPVTSSAGTGYYGISNCAEHFGVTTAQLTFTTGTPIILSSQAPINIAGCSYDNLGEPIFAIHTGTSACETYTQNSVMGNQWFHVMGATGIIASINPNGEDLGTLTVTVGDPSGVSTVGSNKFLGRNVNITSSAYPTGNIPAAYSLKLYYYDTEFDEYKTAISNPTAALADIDVAWASGGTGCDLNDYATAATTNGKIAKANVSEVDYGLPASGGAAGSVGFYLGFNLNHFTVFAPTISASPNPLPVKLLSFTGYKDKTVHRLDWTTATEQNASHFDVQYSATGKDFVTIGTVRAAGNSNTIQKYNFDNKNTNTDIHYYQLKIVDFDGSFDYSNVITIVEKESKYAIKCYPNPTGNLLYIDAIDRTQAVSITDEIGRTVQTYTTTPNQIDLSNLTAGVYYVRIGYQYFKIVKL